MSRVGRCISIGSSYTIVIVALQGLSTGYKEGVVTYSLGNYLTYFLF